MSPPSTGLFSCLLVGVRRRVSLPFGGKWWVETDVTYEVMMPRYFAIASDVGADVLRTFKTPEEAVGFLAHENASPLRTHLLKGHVPASLREKVLGQLGSGGRILHIRDDGWDLCDSEGWCRYRHCRPTTIQGLTIPEGEEGLVGSVGDLDAIGYTLALTSDGR